MVRHVLASLLLTLGLAVVNPQPAFAVPAEPGGQFLCGGKLGLDEADTCAHWYIAQPHTNTALHTDAQLSSPPRPGDWAYSQASTQFTVLSVGGNPIHYRTLYAFATATCETTGSTAPAPTLAGESVVTGLTIVGRRQTIPDTTQYQRITTPTAYIDLNVQLRLPVAGGGTVLVQRPLVITPRTPDAEPIIPVEARVGYEESAPPSIGGGPCRY